MDSRPPPPDSAAPPEAGPPPPAPEPSVAAGVSPFRSLLIYLALPIVSVVAMALTRLDPMLAPATSGLAAGFYWYAFARTNPRVVGMILVGVILATYYVLSPYCVLWIVAGALAGGMGAWLQTREAYEDDFFFGVMGTALIAYALLVLLSWGLKVSEPLADVSSLIDRTWIQIEVEYQKSEGNTLGRLLGPSATALPSESIRGPFLVSFFFGFWALGLWIAGRLARRSLGALHNPRAALLMFRLRPRYIFLLIAGLILEIVGGLTRVGAVSYIAWPLLVVVASAAFLEGVAVVIFFGAVRRSSGKVRSAYWLSLLGLLILFTNLPIGVMLGLADVWFDFRKLASVET